MPDVDVSRFRKQVLRMTILCKKPDRLESVLNAPKPSGAKGADQASGKAPPIITQHGETGGNALTSSPEQVAGVSWKARQ